MTNACLHLLEQPEAKLQGLFNDATPPLMNVGCGEDLAIKELAGLVKEVVVLLANKSFIYGMTQKLLLKRHSSSGRECLAQLVLMNLP
jgi:hypothetical protein